MASNGDLTRTSLQGTTLPLLPAPTTIQQYLNIKLTADNFLLWESQFLPLLYYDLLGFIESSKPCPNQYITSGDEKSQSINLEYELWMKQDQLLLSCIISSMSKTVLAQVVELKTTYEVWIALKRSYAAHSRSRIMQLKEQLQGLWKRNLTMDDYFYKAKMLAHQLAVASKPVEGEYLIMHILRGLLQEYSTFKTSLITRVDPISLSDLHSLLLTQETQFKEQDLEHETFAPTTHYAQPYSVVRENFDRRQPSMLQRGRGRGRGRSDFERGRSDYGGRNRIICMFCDKMGHSAKNYFKIARKDNTRAATTNSNASSSSNAQVYHSSPHMLDDANWIPNTGATHHITNSLGSMTIHEPYEGNDSV
uniref:Retrotransposon Copia-like N-terminal domain-containing protein n=1 Tax=Nymphaea colorata TaxID=210225 RepID=A0A5K0V5S1_9MAGN